MSIMSTRLTTLLRRLKTDKRGYTLTEALVTMLLVAVVTAAMSTGIAFAARQMTSSLELSEGVVLQSTLKNVVANELAVTSDATVANAPGSDGLYALTNFFSVNYGDVEAASQFVVIDQSGNQKASSAGFGQLAIASGSKVKKLISQASYTNGLQAQLSVAFCPASSSASSSAYFKAKLTIVNAQGKTVTEDTFDVNSYNQEALEVKTQSGTTLE